MKAQLKILSTLLVSTPLMANAQLDHVFKNGFEEIKNLLNDTGITYGAEYDSINNSDCSSNSLTGLQDCDLGRDATHNDTSDGHAGFSYTKLDVDGNVLLASANDWSCVRDNFTGLVWEAKTDDGGIHDKANTYRWGGITHQGSFGTEFYDDWDDLVNGSNNENLCGFNDWQVPDKQQLSNLLNLSQFAPAVDIDYFPFVNSDSSSRYWTATPSAKNANNAWFIVFDFGTTGNLSRSGA